LFLLGADQPALAGQPEEKAMMEKILIENSTHLRAAGYDALGYTLQLWFRDSSTYQYTPVIPELWNDFQQAESKGKWVWHHLRADPSITCAKVLGAD
jgi:KTSC domain